MNRLSSALERPAAGWIVCGLLAAVMLAPALRRGGFGPGDLLLSMTPWSEYRDRFPDVRGVGNPQLDVIQQYCPWRIYASHWLRRGVIPLWNPHAYCGQPFVANVLSAVFYPFTWLALALPVGVFFLLSAWFHLTLLGAGLCLLLRSHGLRPTSALAGAVVMMWNTFVLGWLAYANLSQWTYAWAPLLLYAWRAAWLARRPRGLAWPALLLAVSALGGHVQIAFYVALAWLIYAAATVLTEGRARDLLVWVALPAVAAGTLAALQMVPAYDLVHLSGRTKQSYGDAVASKLPASMLGVLVMPWFYGHNALHLPDAPWSFWGPYNNGIEASASAGAAALALAVVALSRRRGPAVWVFAAIATVGLLMAFGTPAYWLFYRLVPGFSSLRGLSRAFALVNLGLAPLAGFGAEALAEPDRPAGRRLATGLVVGTALLVLYAWIGEVLRVAPNVPTALTPELTGYALTQSLLALAAAGAVSVAAARTGSARWVWLAPAVELLVLGLPLHRGVEPGVFFFDTPETRFLSSREQPYRLVGVPAPGRPPFLDWMPMNTPMAYGVSSPCGSESLSYSAYNRLLARFWDAGSFQPKLGHPLLNLVGARYVLSRADLDGVHGLRRVGGERCGVFENPAALTTVFGTYRWHRGNEQTLDALAAQPGYDPATVVLPPDGPAPPRVTPGPAVSCLVSMATPQRTVASGRLASPGLVVWTATRGPGWTAWVDGRPVVNWSADGVFQAVEAGPGPVIVRWVYQPVSFRAGLFVSLLALAALAAWVTGHGARVTRHERGPAGAAGEGAAARA